MEKTLEQKKIESLEFFSEAFCIDGEARFVDPKKYKIVGAIELTDSKRGTFVVGRLEPN